MWNKITYIHTYIHTYITVQVSAVQYSAVQYREAFEEAGDVKREDENLHGSRGGVQYIVVQYSTVQVSAVQYRDYKNDGQWTRQNEGINPKTQIRVKT